MKNKIPHIQKAWRRFQELYEDNQEKLSFWEIMLSLNDIILLVIPYILAGYQYSSVNRPARRRTFRKNRNL